jgi:hypothetical protein
MNNTKYFFAKKSIYFNVWPSLFQDSSQTTIKAELVFSGAYMRDYVRKYCREAVCILAGKHCSVNWFMSPPYVSYNKSV